MSAQEPSAGGGELPSVVRCKTCSARHGMSFCNFSRQALEVFVRIGYAEETTPHQTLFELGEPSRGVFIVCEGELRVTRRERGSSVTWTAVPGDVLGLHETMAHQPYRSTVQTLSNCRLRYIPAERFEEFLEDEVDASIWAVHFL